ncbi:MAG: ABC transporter permease [Deltaproteobacteria bacterium]|jgi:putative ABC transport system permease protein|nr:ABC transporter permease [Deltaproteobacteria bacterium]
MILAAKSAWNRRGTLALILISIILSTVLLAGLERLRTQVRASFVQSIAGTDLLAGARGSSLQLVLYAVFHLGGASSNMGWEKAREIAAYPETAWTVPLSLGDTHRGFPVVASDENLWTHFRWQRDRKLTLASGRPFEGLFEVVLGAETARRLGYRLNQNIVLAHGSGEAARQHDDKPFIVTGILSPTGSPADRSLFISLESMEAIHLDWRGGAPLPGLKIKAEDVRKFNLTPKSITALMIGLKNRRQVFAVQSRIQAAPGEPLTAVLPGVALDQLFSLLGNGEKILFLVSILVTVTGLLGLAAAILAGLGERRRELAVLRSLGASPWDILILISLESLWLTLLGLVIGVIALAGIIAAAGPWLLTNYGAALELSPPTQRELVILAGILAAGLLTGLGPAVRAYYFSLNDGLSGRI